MIIEIISDVLQTYSIGEAELSRACGAPLAMSHRVYEKYIAYAASVNRSLLPLPARQLQLLPTRQLLLLLDHQLLLLANSQLLSLPATQLLQSEKRLLKGAQERPKSYQLLPETPKKLL